MRRLWTLLFVLVLLAAAFPASAASPTPPPLTTLQPGAFREITQDLTVNVVFVGFEQGAGARDITQSVFEVGLPETYEVVNRYPKFYGLRAKLGLAFNFDYNIVYASSTYENDLFGYLGSIAVPMPRTLFQNDYNAQINNSVTITDSFWIDAPSVEAWLATHPITGVDTKNYTVYYINWYGRPDFKFHAYTKIGEPDPETGYDFGLIRASRKLTAWGGTTPDDEESGLGSLHRIWFYDLSAGPEGWSDNWNVDDADLDGNGVMDYRIPPVWEYGHTGYRPFNDLSGDLAKVTRYVAIDLLFTPSPLYKPALSPPALPETVQVDINVYQGLPGIDAKGLFSTTLIAQELGELQPLQAYSVELSDAALTDRAAQVYLCFLADQTCFGNKLFGIAFGDLFLYHNDHLMQFLDGDADYEVPLFSYNVPDELNAGGLLGFADDNWRDGTQSYIFTFYSPYFGTLGYGNSGTAIHEAGHHVGMSHPHDGYDYQTDTDFGPSDEFQFAWLGDMSNSIMNYLDLNYDFSQFDRDSMARYQTVAYINQANMILSRIYASPRAGNANGLLNQADAHAGQALLQYGQSEWASAAAHAKMAYDKVLEAAAKINVQVEPQSWQADYKSKGQSYPFVDPVDYQRSKP